MFRMQIIMDLIVLCHLSTSSLRGFEPEYPMLLQRVLHIVMDLNPINTGLFVTVLALNNL